MIDSFPVTITINRRVRKGKENDYEEWVKRIVLVAATFPGYLGINLLKPSQNMDEEYVLIVKFDNYRHQQVWEHSAERATFHQELGKLTEGEPKVSKVTGLEYWFSLPEIPSHSVPNQHKMAVVLCVVVFLLVLIVNIFLGEQLARFSLVLRCALLSVTQVMLLTYLIMPKVTGLLKNWIYKPTK